MQNLKILFALCFLAIFICFANSKSLITENNKIMKRQNNQNPTRTFNSFIHRIMKRSPNDQELVCPNTTVQNSQASLMKFFREFPCKRTLTQYEKNDCKHVAQNLEIGSWPQASSTCDACRGSFGYTDVPRHVSTPASTIVKVWDSNIRIWKKIRVIVGYFCYKKNI